jgi:molecular chaperone GrpE
MARDIFGRHQKPRDDDEQIRVTDRRRILVNENDEVDPNAVADEPSLKPRYVEELEARTKAAEQKVHEVNSRFEDLRKQLQKETDETRQRLNKAADERAHREKANFISALLPVLDNLHRASEAAASGASPSDVGEGVRQTASAFENALTAAGVEPIDSIGQPFDPEFHEAVETSDVSEAEDGKVIAEHSRGYKMGDRLLRPAKVKVGRYAERANQASE